MLRNIKRTIQTNVLYPNLEITRVSTNPETIAHESLSNGTAREQTFRLSGSKTVNVYREWSVSATLLSSLNIEVRSPVPVVAIGDVKTTWTVNKLLQKLFIGI
ncbi:hypothetical protein DPMN_059862 [Dreissena polymorpha]|uniref:Uncharacterized protein n=1 Tax=Dreissena polymorpha TaxID=45954 RepID=A0A9D4C4P0_DREPO|nr:hypothetical protein DPMN_059862 [Dreissena polymorpha]